MPNRRPRNRAVRREDPGLDALVADLHLVETKPEPEKEPDSKPFEKVQIGPVGGSIRKDQEAWVKATNRWGR